MTDLTVEPIVFGATYSVYTRIVLLTLTEKAVAYRLEEVDIFAADGPPVGYLERQPFGRIPAFEHDGLRLFETTAICRYVDEAFPGPALTPDDLSARALMAQTIGLVDSYAYRALVWDVFVELIAKPQEGEATDQTRVDAGLKTARTVLAVLEAQLDGKSFLAGDALTLADLHAWPVFDYFCQTDPGDDLLQDHKNVQAWTARMTQRDASKATAFPS